MVIKFAELLVVCNYNLIYSKYTVLSCRPHWPVSRIYPWYFEILSTLHFRSKAELWGTLGMSNMLSCLWKTDHHRVNQFYIPYHGKILQPNIMQEDSCIFDSITPNLLIVLRSYDAICWPLYPSLVWYKIVNGGIFFRKRGITSICIVCIIAKIRVSVLFCFLTCPQRSPLIKLHLRIEISITSRNI